MNEKEAKEFLREHVIVKVISDSFSQEMTATEWHDAQEGEQCPECAAYNLPMGRLGNMDHFNCRQCGMWYYYSD